jgi:hypothetical protein
MMESGSVLSACVISTTREVMTMLENPPDPKMHADEIDIDVPLVR